MFEDDDVGEGTRIFCAEQAAEFRKHFPLPSDKPQRGMLTKNMHTVQKPIFQDNCFDETLPEQFYRSKSGANAELFEQKEENRVLCGKLKRANEELANLKKEAETFQRSRSSLIDEVASLRNELMKNERKLEDNMNDSSILQTSACEELDQYQRVSSKLYNWRRKDRFQLECMKNILVREGLWTKQIRNEIYDSYKSVPCIDMSEDAVTDLCRGSILDYVGLEDVENADEEEETASDESQSTSVAQPYNDTFSLFARPAVPSVREEKSMMSSSSVSVQRIPSPISSETSMDVSNSFVQGRDDSQVSVFDQTIGTDFENFETIQRLEEENERLKRENFVLQGRSKSALLIKEQKLNLEQKNKCLSEQLDNTMKELCAIRDATSRGIFDAIDGVDKREQARVITQRVTTLQLENDRLTVEISRLKEEMVMIKEDNTDLEETLNDERSQLYNRKAQIEENRKALEAKDLQISQLQQCIHDLQTEVESLKNEAEKKDKRIEELLKNQKPCEATDAGDTTQIFHMKLNPLEMAREEIKEREETAEKQRKRKQSEMTSNSGEEEEEQEAKRSKDQHVEALMEQLRRAERERSKAVDIQTSLARNYREMTTALTGYQIKMRGDNEWHVVSCYGSEPEDMFAFQYSDGNLHLLSNMDEGSSNASETKWKEEMDRYIGSIQSIPAFLSQVTLSLLEVSRSNETVCQPSFSVVRE